MHEPVVFHQCFPLMIQIQGLPGPIGPLGPLGRPGRKGIPGNDVSGSIVVLFYSLTCSIAYRPGIARS